MNALRYLILLFLLNLCSIAFTQSNNIKFDQLQNNLDISNANVTCILQDSRGFMWLGTFDGLNRYDGYQFTIYKNNPAKVNSISNNSIKSVIQDKKQNMWVGTWGGGLNKFDSDRNEFTHFKHNLANANSIASDFVTCLLVDKQDNVWIGTGDGGLDMFDRKKNQFIHYIHSHDSKALGNNYVTSVFADSKDNLWIGSINGGLLLLDKKSGTFKAFQHNDKDSNSLCNNDVNVIFEDSRKNLWIGTNNEGFDRMNTKTGTFTHFKNNLLAGNKFSDYAVIEITEDDKENFWIGTRDGGLNIFNPLTGLSHNYHHDDLDVTSLARNTIPFIYNDQKKNMWISTLAAGVNFVNIAGNEFNHYEHNSSGKSLSDNNVSSFYEDSDKNLWIGTEGGGLNMFDPKLGSFVYYRHQANNRNSICGNNVLSLCEDYKQNLWIGTWGAGITVFNKNKNTFRQIKNNPNNNSSLSSNNVWSIFEDREKNIWIGTYGEGLDLYNPGNNTFTHYKFDENNPTGINNNYVITIFEDSKGFIWIGTDGGGLNQFNKTTKQFIHYVHKVSTNSLSYNFVSDIFEDKMGNLYIATGTGLNYFNTTTHHFTDYTSIDDFKNESASGIMQDVKGNLWISRGEGISCFNPLKQSFINFNTDDGLHTNTYNSMAYYQDRDGVMYCGGKNGFDQFLPGNIKKVSFDPPLVVTNFQIFNKDVTVAKDENDPSPLKQDITETKKITIPYRSSVISFEFASLHYGVKDRKQYAYMLEGFDKTWNEVGNKRIATYTNLDPGKYAFKVKGLNNEGKWSSNIKNIQLIITPPFWLTWWFKSGLLLLIIGSVFGVHKFRMNIIHTQKQKLEQRVYDQTEQLIKSTGEEQTARKEAEQANIDLEKKNKEMQQFSYIVSHNLRTPVANIIGFSEMLSGLDLDEETMGIIAALSASSEKLDTVILDLNEILKVRKDLSENKIPVCLSSMVQDIITSIDSLIKEKEVQIKFDFTEADELVTIKSYLYSICYNLITNSIKYHQPGIKPEINIKSYRNDNKIELIFSDNGMGMDLSTKGAQVFGLYKRFHTHIEGKGLGLFMTKTQVETLGGKISVESEVNKGTAFKIQFNI